MLIPTIDENGDEVLVCETGPDGEDVWRPTPEQFQAYLERDAQLAKVNVLTARINEVLDGNHERTVVVAYGVPCDGYRYQRGRLEPWWSREKGPELYEHGPYRSYAVKVGGATPDDTLHCNATFAATKAVQTGKET